MPHGQCPRGKGSGGGGLHKFHGAFGEDPIVGALQVQGGVGVAGGRGAAGVWADEKLGRKGVVGKEGGWTCEEPQ